MLAPDNRGATLARLRGCGDWAPVGGCAALSPQFTTSLRCCGEWHPALYHLSAAVHEVDLASGGLDIMLASIYADFRPQWRLYLPAQVLNDQHLRRVIEQAVAPAFDVVRHELWAQTRGSPTTAFARQVAMYLAHVGCGLTLTEVGRLFARDRTTVAHACGLVEDRREQPPFDRALELLEGAMRLSIPGPA